MLRLMARRLISVTCLPTAPVTDTTGGIGRSAASPPFTFLGSLQPPKRSLARTVSGVRPAVTWTLLPQGKPLCREQDRLMFQNDERVYVITAIRRYPRHLAYLIEAL